MRFIFDPHAATIVEPESVRKCVVARERRGAKTNSSNFRYSLVKIANDFGSCYKVKTQRCSKRIPCQISLKGDIRIGVATAA